MPESEVFLLSDGKIVFDTSLNNDKLEKELSQLKNEIKELNSELTKKNKDVENSVKRRDRLYEDLAKKQEQYKMAQEKTEEIISRQSPIVEQIEATKAKIAEAEQAVSNYQKQWLQGISGADQQESKARETLSALEEEYRTLVAQADKFAPAIDKAAKKESALKTEMKGLEVSATNAKHEVRNLREDASGISRELEKAKENAGGIEQQLAAAEVKTKKMDMATQKASKSSSKFASRIKEVVRSALIFTLITQALARFRGWMGKVVKTNAEATAAIARLKGALLTLAQPLVNVIIPAFTAFVNVLTRIVSEVAQLISALFGTTVQASSEAAESLYDEQSAIEGVGSAAKKAGKSLASFDEINQLSNSSSGASGGAGGSNETIKPDFSIQEGNGLLGIVRAIGEAFLAWRIGSKLKFGLKKTLGLLTAIHFGIEFAKNLMDAWTNGINMDNLIDTLRNAALAVAGLGIAFGKTGAAIGLIVAGVAMIVTGIHDMLENGMTLENTLYTIAGLLASGLGISLLTNSWIPLLLAGIASILLAIVNAYGDTEAFVDGIRNILEGFKEFFVGVFTGDLEKALDGIGKVFDGLRAVIGTILDAVICLTVFWIGWMRRQAGKFTESLNFAVARSIHLSIGSVPLF